MASVTQAQVRRRFANLQYFCREIELGTFLGTPETATYIVSRRIYGFE